MLNVVIKAKLFFPLGPLQNCTFRQTFSTFHLQKSTFGVQNKNNDRFVRRTSHTSFGIPGLESDDRDVGHTPIFSQSVLVRKSDVGAHIHFYLRMQESYKRFVKTWIRFANPWIHIVSWSQILTPKRFDLCLTKRILDSYRIVDHKSWL